MKFAQFLVDSYDPVKAEAAKQEVEKAIELAIKKSSALKSLLVNADDKAEVDSVIAYLKDATGKLNEVMTGETK